MLEPGCEPRFAQEAPPRSVIEPHPRVQHLDDHLAPEQLVTAIDGAEATFADPLA